MGVVVLGEKPYAEFEGDCGNLLLDPEDDKVIDAMKAAGIPVEAVHYSGRPLVLGDSSYKSDALIAAWLPSMERQGIADVLFGE